MCSSGDSRDPGTAWLDGLTTQPGPIPHARRRGSIVLSREANGQSSPLHSPIALKKRLQEQQFSSFCTSALHNFQPRNWSTRRLGGSSALSQVRAWQHQWPMGTRPRPTPPVREGVCHPVAHSNTPAAANWRPANLKAYERPLFLGAIPGPSWQALPWRWVPFFVVIVSSRANRSVCTR
jgi:hypothetical protein